MQARGSLTRSAASVGCFAGALPVERHLKPFLVSSCSSWYGASALRGSWHRVPVTFQLAGRRDEKSGGKRAARKRPVEVEDGHAARGKRGQKVSPSRFLGIRRLRL